VLSQTILATFCFVLTFLLGAADGFYSATYSSTPNGFLLLFAIAFTWAAFVWIRMDAIRLGIKLPFDFGFFLFLLWPILGPWHIFQTRGFMGAVWILLFIGTYALAAFASYTLTTLTAF